MESYLRRIGEWRRGTTNFFGNSRRHFKPTPPSVIDLSRLRQAQQPRSQLQQQLLSRRRGSFFRDKATSARSGVQEATANCCLTARGLYSQSTVPGFIQMAQARNPFRIIIWFVAFVGLGSVALSNLYELMHEYFQYPLTVNIRLEDVNNVEFPAVTLCNLNPVRKSLLCGQETDLDYTLQEFLCNKTAEMTVHARSLDWFTAAVRLSAEACYLCNEARSLESISVVGLELLIAVEQYEYLPITPEAGYMVMIHKQGHDPEEATDGIFVAPGQTTYVGVTVLCLKLCQQGAVLKNCSCESSFMPAPSYNSYNVCDVLNNNEKQVIVRVTLLTYKGGHMDRSTDPY
ncbi:hypothetical protein HPB52_025614 [Rhipicephalus sanguineus]|uniref:Uncharacterized protein n=1 Tax=Rhipicephalus sanguineus TaxID=34632 RepID=A0A9D4SMV3_RHISA|nr:hypothetical protein HPB52_025614 [Rhipicephalus sanguineus]